MCLNNLRDLLVEELNALHSVSVQTLAVLPQMAQAATALEVRRIIQNYADDKRAHVADVEQALQKLGAAPSDKKCPSVEGLIEEAREMIRATGDPEVLDTGLTLRVMRLQQHTLTINDAVVCTYNKILAAQENERLDEDVNQKAFFIKSKTVH